MATNWTNQLLLRRLPVWERRDPLTRKDVVLPVITFVSGAAIALITAFASPLANRIIGGKEEELRQRATELTREFAALKKSNGELQDKYDDVLNAQLEEWNKKNRRLISYQVAVLENEIRKTIDRHQAPTVEILGINATGPLHQGREALIEAVKSGGVVRILVLDPASQDFDSRAEFEGDNVARIAAELMASLHIVMDIAQRAAPSNTQSVEIRLSQRAADRSLIVVNPEAADGVVLSNPYESLRQKRGLIGKMWKFATGERYGKEDSAYFDELWNSAERIELQKVAITDWPFRRVGQVLHIGP